MFESTVRGTSATPEGRRREEKGGEGKRREERRSRRSLREERRGG